jgi:hypothetical protein
MSTRLTESERRERERQLAKAYPRPGEKPEQQGTGALKQAPPDTRQGTVSRASHYS